MDILNITLFTLDFVKDLLGKQLEKRIAYDCIVFDAPFRLLDYFELHKEVLKTPNEISPAVNYTLKQILQLAELNINIYTEFINSQERNVFTHETSFWKISLPWDIDRLESVNSFTNPSQHLENYSFIDFCVKVAELLTEILPDDPLKVRYKASNAQIALFFYCMIEGKLIKRPGKQGWQSLIRNTKYKFPGRLTNKISSSDVYNLITKVGRDHPKNPLTKVNLVFCIDHLLIKHPAALRFAEDQLASLEKQ
jgi:hypothetical protein